MIDRWLVAKIKKKKKTSDYLYFSREILSKQENYLLKETLFKQSLSQSFGISAPNVLSLCE